MHRTTAGQKFFKTACHNFTETSRQKLTISAEVSFALEVNMTAGGQHKQNVKEEFLRRVNMGIEHEFTSDDIG